MNLEFQKYCSEGLGCSSGHDVCPACARACAPLATLRESQGHQMSHAGDKSFPVGLLN